MQTIGEYLLSTKEVLTSAKDHLVKNAQSFDDS